MEAMGCFTCCTDENKSEIQGIYTNMDFVNEHRDFSKITKKDLKSLFAVLNKRCPETWTAELEQRAEEFHRKFMILKREETNRYIDPEQTDEDGKDTEPELKRLIIFPECWSMSRKEQAAELREILRHFTIFAPFEGRPFVRAWLEALLPCFSRWTLLSDSNNNVLLKTFKHFLGAFGQPGIVVCLADKGASMLQTLKNAARAVEAVGRGTVERYYWTRQAELSPEWRQLASLKSMPLEVSQLDYLPKWLEDSTDWGHVFANIVSPEISKHFWRKIDAALGKKKLYKVSPGPPKTLARTLAKGCEYYSEFLNEKDLPRWHRFAKNFKNFFQREPDKSTDFVWNIVDFARCSITVPGALEALQAKRLIEEQFKVVCIKNGYNSEVKAKGSGYRDCKLLVEVEFDDLQLEGVAQVQPTTTMLCEVQIVCQAWYVNKKTTSLPYKILRAQSLSSLLNDASKYTKMKKEPKIPKTDPVAIIKKGWVNLAKAVDFSDVNVDKLLLTAANEGWSAAGVNILVQDLKANLDARDKHDGTPLLLACLSGSVHITELLVNLGSDIETRDSFNGTALLWAARNRHEGCVRILLDAEASVGVKNNAEKSSLDYALDNLRVYGTKTDDRIVKLLKGEVGAATPTNELVEEPKMSMLEEIEEAAIEGYLGWFLDNHDIPNSLMSAVLTTKATVATLENILQVLWFGADVGHKKDTWTPLHYAVKYGTTDTVSVLLNAHSPLEVKTGRGWTPLFLAVRNNKSAIVKLLLEANAQVNVKDQKGWSPLLHAAMHSCGKTVAELLKFGANRKDLGEDESFVYYAAIGNPIDSDNVLNVLGLTNYVD